MGCLLFVWRRRGHAPALQSCDSCSSSSDDKNGTSRRVVYKYSDDTISWHNVLEQHLALLGSAAMPTAPWHLLMICRGLTWSGTKASSTLIFVVALLLLMMTQEATGTQPFVGASLSWTISQGFHLGDRRVNFTLHSTVQMVSSCIYAVGSRVTCSNSTAEAPNSPCDTVDHTSDVNLCRVGMQHGVLCVGQLVPSAAGGFELLYASHDGGACVSNLQPGALAAGVKQNASDNHVGKVNDFMVLSHSQGVAEGTLTHEVLVADESIALVVWLSSSLASSQSQFTGENGLLPGCTGAEEPGVPCCVSMRATNDTLLIHDIWRGVPSTGLHAQHSLFTQIPLCSKAAATLAVGLDDASCTTMTLKEFGGAAAFLDGAGCDAGTANRPPIFVTGLLSQERKVPTVFTCHTEQVCEIPLYVRDLTLESPPRQSFDHIAIEALFQGRGGHQEDTEMSTLFTADGARCNGTGALHCVYKLKPMTAAPATYVRCFSAYDIHDAAAAPERRMCRSSPLCLKIRVIPGVLWLETFGLYKHISTLKVHLAMRERRRFRGAAVLFRWTDANNVEMGGADVFKAIASQKLVFQYTCRQAMEAQQDGSAASDKCSFEQRFFDIPPKLIELNGTNHAYIDTAELLRISVCTSRQCEFRFRLFNQSIFGESAQVPYRGEFAYHGPVTNTLILSNVTRGADKALIVASWQSGLLRVLDAVAAKPGKNVLAHLDCNPVTPGSFTFDSTGGRLFVIIESDDSPEIEIMELVMIDISSGSIRRNISYGLNVSWRNIEYDEASDLIFAVEFSQATCNRTVSSCTHTSSHSSLISLSPNTGDKKRVTDLPAVPRMALTTYNRRDSVFFYVLQASTDVQRISLELGQPAQHLSPIKIGLEGQGFSRVTSCNVVHAMSYNEVDGMLYTLEGPWPLLTGENRDLILLATYDGYLGNMLSRITTSLSGIDIAYAVVAFHVNMSSIIMISSRDTKSRGYVVYDIDSNHTDRQDANAVGLVGTVIHVDRFHDRRPVLSALTSPSVHTDSSNQITIAGFNFGMRDDSPVMAFQPPIFWPCKNTAWLSDNILVCLLPENPDFIKRSLRDLSVDALVTIGTRRSNVLQATTFTESWSQPTSPLSSNVLTFPRTLTILGSGFEESCKSYRMIFSNEIYLTRSGPPIFHNTTHMTFEIPAWLAPAAQCRLSLQRMGIDSLSEWPKHVIHHAGPPISFKFTQAWYRITPSMGRAGGATAVTFSGAGLDTSGNNDYSCAFRSDLLNFSLTEQAVVLSHRQAVCQIEGWPVAAGRVSAWLFDGNAPVQRTVSTNAAHPLSLPFIFTKGWKSLRPTEGTITDNSLIHITGFGFNVSSAYVCIFSRTNDTVAKRYGHRHTSVNQNVTAKVHNSTLLTCPVEQAVGKATFPLALVTILEIGEDSAAMSVYKQGDPEHYSWMPTWLSVQPSRAFASGGDVVQILGIGFPAHTFYECVFFQPQDPSLTTVLVNATWRSEEMIECVMPVWPHPAGDSRVRVRRRKYGPVSLTAIDLATFDFKIIEILLQSQHPAFAYSGVLAGTLDCISGEEARGLPSPSDCLNPAPSPLSCTPRAHPISYQCVQIPYPWMTSPINVSFVGRGFDPASVYTCRLSAHQFDLTGTDDVNLKGMRLNSTVFVAATSTELIICPLMSWPYFSGLVNLSLERDGTMIKGGEMSSQIVIKERWQQVKPRSLSATGTIVTVYGHGFGGVAADYTCEFSQANNHGHYSFTVNALNVSLHRITCHLPGGLGGLQGGVTHLTLHKQAAYLLQPPEADTSLMITEIITGLSPSSGTARGGDLITIFGYGFVVSQTTYSSLSFGAGDYVVSFGGIFSPNCTVHNQTMIVCVSPDWKFPAAEALELMVWYSLTIPEVALVPGLLYGADLSVSEQGLVPPVGPSCASVPGLTSLDLCSNPRLMRCTNALQESTKTQQCMSHVPGQEWTCVTTVADDPDSGVCVGKGACFQHHHCPRGMLCSAPALEPQLRSRFTSGTCMWPRTWCSSGFVSSLMSGGTDGQYPVIATAGFDCQHHARFSFCDSSALNDGVTAWESAYHAPHVDVETCGQSVYVQLDFGRPVRIKAIRRWLYWKAEIIGSPPTATPRQYCNQRATASISEAFTDEETVLFSCYTFEVSIPVAFVSKEHFSYSSVYLLAYVD